MSHEGARALKTLGAEFMKKRSHDYQKQVEDMCDARVSHQERGRGGAIVREA